MANFIYEVVVIMKNENLTANEVKSFIEDELEDVEIIHIEANVVILSWEVDEDEGSHEIEEALYYVLDDEEIGTYKYTLME